MPPVEHSMGVPPERVWEILSDPPAYAYWVVGSRTVEDWDPNWPAPGTRFHHTQGRRPLIIRDYTESVAAEEPRHLELTAYARPLLIAKVIIDIKPEAGGCRVWMEEVATGGLIAPLMRIPPNPQLTKLRNKESLKRIRQLAEGKKG
jgi:uncharacterized protein YndB with AHSA1/START domain